VGGQYGDFLAMVDWLLVIEKAISKAVRYRYY
jgi:hypothetical protein